MAKARFLLGRGELLTETIPPPKMGGKKKEIYAFKEALRAARPRLAQASEYFDELDNILCPDDYAVGQFILNPAYIAKSYFPSRFFRAADLVPLGSKNVRNTPRKWAKKGAPIEGLTTSIFVAGQRSTFRNLPAMLERWIDDSTEAREFARLEDFTAYRRDEKLKNDPKRETEHFEVGLHLLPNGDQSTVLHSFVRYVEGLGGQVLTDLHFEVGNLWFVPVTIAPETFPLIADHSFVRVVRPVPKLRGLRPMVRNADVTLNVRLPESEALSTEPRVALLDGGLPEQHPIGPWLHRYQKSDPAEASLPGGEEHGLGVASAFLFGPLKVNEAASRPYSNVTCIRVLDAKTNQDDPMELYRTLGFIEEVLLSRQYQFVNLSLGPDLPIDDDDIHAWTSVIDSILEDGETLLTVAIGNNGEADKVSGNARIQVPSDSVNAVGIGASDREHEFAWQRASYSAIGPGRRPGVVKPDLVTFGGSPQSYFHHLNPGLTPTVAPTMGTSFSSPFGLRTAVGVRAVLGRDISPLAIKGLLIHSAHQNGLLSEEVGWGCIAPDLSRIVNCPDGMVRVVYQGELKAGKYLRAKVPVPDGGIKGMVTMSATFCYACQTDPQDASSYTRAGLEITFRPDLNKKAKGSEMPTTRSFFNMDKYCPEGERRSDFGKWETVLHDEEKMRGSTLKAPVFDIHYNAREGGSTTQNAVPIKYALIITIEAPRHASLYGDVLEAYSEILVPIQSDVEVPITL